MARKVAQRRKKRNKGESKNDRRAGLTRLFYLAGQLRADKPIGSTSEARKRGLSRRTIERDIKFLRALGWKIEWNQDLRTYVLISAPKPKLF